MRRGNVRQRAVRGMMSKSSAVASAQRGRVIDLPITGPEHAPSHSSLVGQARKKRPGFLARERASGMDNSSRRTRVCDLQRSRIVTAAIYPDARLALNLVEATIDTQASATVRGAGVRTAKRRPLHRAADIAISPSARCRRPCYRPHPAPQFSEPVAVGRRRRSAAVPHPALSAATPDRARPRSGRASEIPRSAPAHHWGPSDRDRSGWSRASLLCT